MGAPLIGENNYGLMKLRREYKRATDDLEDCRKKIDQLTEDLDTARKDEESMVIIVDHYRAALIALGYEP